MIIKYCLCVALCMFEPLCLNILPHTSQTTLSPSLVVKCNAEVESTNDPAVSILKLSEVPRKLLGDIIKVVLQCQFYEA